MTTWYALSIDESEASKKLMQRIMDAFMPKYIGSGRPMGMAIFSGRDTETGDKTIFFSPKSASLAMQFGASSYGNEFANKELSLLVGDEGSIDYLFPDADSE